MVKLLYKLFEIELCGVSSEQQSPRSYSLWFVILVHFMHQEREHVCLKEGKHVSQYWRIPKHALCGEFKKMIMDVLSQKGIVIELDAGLIFSRENG